MLVYQVCIFKIRFDLYLGILLIFGIRKFKVRSKLHFDIGIGYIRPPNYLGCSESSVRRRYILLVQHMFE